MKNEWCPCFSGVLYVNCCKPFHEGKAPKTAEKLMRSRFSAYAKGLVDYIIKTTHSKSVLAQQEKSVWKKSIEEFCKLVSFEDLKIFYSKEKEDIAVVIFYAFLKQGKEDVSFSEKSYFKKEKEGWLYYEGEVEMGYHPERFTQTF